MKVRTFQLHSATETIPADPSWDGPRTLVLAFFAPEMALDQRTLLHLRSAFPQSFLLGASTGGEILGARLEDHTVAVAVLRFASTELAIAKEEVSGFESSREAGRLLGQTLSHPDLKGVFVLTSGLGINGWEIVHGLNQVLDSRVSVTGGVAAGGDDLGPTFSLGLAPGEPLLFESHQVVGVGFRGDAIRLRSASKGGWTPFGLERTVTRSRGNILYELDGKPALALYKTYLGDRAQGLPVTASLFPLAILDEQAYGPDALVRSVLAVDESEQSLIFGGDILEGSLVQLMHSSVDRLVEAAAEAAERLGGRDAAPGLSIAVSCMGRRVVLGERAEEELEAVMETLPQGTQQVGFYAHGELSPSTSGKCHLHNQTMTLTLIQEA
ncbi:FIST signal transduction protein [Holophaga foetida]|uniref:FIST signal transduction protein n=1 Tax=Holophaga foetida TaxID=35839 RepID=UPI0002475384|nr:FIST N-terminal domain-containing protein [Holophaga foetida]